MLKFVTILFCFVIAIAGATDVKKCSNNRPFPLDVRVHGCDAPPCDIIKGQNTVFEIDFVTYKHVTDAKCLVKATTLGISVPYELPEDVRDVCSNLMYEAMCPLYPTEDVTYYFDFPIGNYPEISVKIEIYLVNQDQEELTCFVCDIKVKKGSGSSRNATIYQLDWTA